MPPMDFHQTGTGTFHPTSLGSRSSFGRFDATTAAIGTDFDRCYETRKPTTAATTTPATTCWNVNDSQWTQSGSQQCHSRSVWPRVEGGTSHGRACCLARSRPGAQGKATFSSDSAGLHRILRRRPFTAWKPSIDGLIDVLREIQTEIESFHSMLEASVMARALVKI